MHIFICLDDENGILFNNRRQSRDKVVIDKIYEIVGDKTLWIGEYSKALFSGNCIVDDEMLYKAGEDDYCFVENLHLAPHVEKIDTVYIFKWNRKYPSDFKLDITMNSMFHLEATEDFIGNSHERISLERWVR